MAAPLATVANTLTDVYTALGNFVAAQLGLAPGQVVQGYPNRVAMPTGPFVLMTGMLKKRLRTNVDNFAGTSSRPRARPRDGRARPTDYGAVGLLRADRLRIGRTSSSTLLRDNVGCVGVAACLPAALRRRSGTRAADRFRSAI